MMRGYIIFLLLAVVSASNEVPAVVRVRSYQVLGLTDELPFNNKERVLRFACDYPEDEFVAVQRAFPTAQIRLASDMLRKENALRAKSIEDIKASKRIYAEAEVKARELVKKNIAHCQMKLEENCDHFNDSKFMHEDRLAFCDGTKEIPEYTRCKEVRAAMMTCNYCLPDDAPMAFHATEPQLLTCENARHYETRVVLPV